MTGDTNASPEDSVGDVMYLYENGTWTTLCLVTGRWCTVSGAGATNVLNPGQGVMLIRNGVGSVRPTFVGPVGNYGTSTNHLVEGFNLIGLSEGRYVTLIGGIGWTNGAPVGSFDETQADQIVIVEPDYQWRRYIYAPDGFWYDAQTYNRAYNVYLPPAGAYYYERRSGAGTLDITF
jgi:hypothetical protein